MVVRISDKTQNYSKITKLLVKPSLLFKYDIFNYFLIQLNNLHFYILKHLFIPDIVQVLFKLYHAFFYFVHINIMDQLYYSNLLEQYFYFPNKRAKKPLFFSFSNSFFNFSISFYCSFFSRSSCSFN